MVFTELDVAVCLLVSICMLIAFLLGGARTVTGMGKWISTVIITLVFYPAAMKYAEGRFTNPLVGNVATVVMLFIAALITCTFFAIGIMTVLGKFKGSFTDRIFGLVIGFLLGAFIVSGGHFIAVFANDGKTPAWLKDGETYKYTEQGAKYFDELAGHLLKDATAKLKAKQEEMAKRAEEKAKRSEDAGSAALEALEEAGEAVKEEIVEPAGGEDSETIPDSEVVPPEEHTEEQGGEEQ